jgi:hypothetical protein
VSYHDLHVVRVRSGIYEVRDFASDSDTLGARVATFSPPFAWLRARIWILRHG